MQYTDNSDFVGPNSIIETMIAEAYAADREREYVLMSAQLGRHDKQFGSITEQLGHHDKLLTTMTD